ncbi:hypothetical protein O3P69_013200 [Scylla paramamosain]|uniref:Chitin-binding type-2 domain-containing protein n=1 Tax=Scylla paramamosain TaxID=85552 RepID=A0AAW0U0B0_SCYPA
MQTLVFAVLLAAAAAATIPEQEPLSTNVTLPVYGFFTENNASTAAPAEQGDHQPATTSRPGNEQLTYADSQSPPAQPEETLVNHEEPLEQSTQQAHSQPEISPVDAVHTIQAAGENASNDTLQSNSSHAALESSQADQAKPSKQPKQAKQTAPLKEAAVTSSQPPQSYNTHESTPTPKAETTSAAPQEPLNLSSGASFMLGAISTTFSCLDRPYGYYADPDNNCHIFHVCHPSLLHDGSVHTYQYSFMCGEGTVFDQKEMTCVAEWVATPCTEASSFYLRNQEFGQVQERRP